MRLLLYTNQLCDGGAERVMSILANEFCKKGHYVVLVTDYKSERDYRIEEGVNLIVIDGEYEKRIRNDIVRTIKRISTIRKICKEQRIDLLLSFLTNVNFRALIATVGLKTKNIISIRVDPRKEYSSKKTRHIANMLYKRVDGYVFQTEDARNHFIWDTKGKSVIIANPISEQFQKSKYVAKENNVIVSAGRLVNQKNFSLLIEAFSLINDKYPGLMLYIYGQGEQLRNLERKRNELDLKKRVVFAGNVDNLAEVYAKAKIYVQSSDYEGMPNALMEAMAMGLPCISTDCDGGGAAYLIRDGVNGFIVPKEDSVALAKKMDDLIGNDVLRRRIGKNARARCQEFSKEKISSHWEEFFCEILNK